MMKKVCIVAAMVLSLGVEAFGQERGQSALPGIDTLPMEAVQLSRERMKNLFIVTDAYDERMIDFDNNVDSIYVLLQHNKVVQEAACNGYITKCDYTDSLTTPFTFLAKYPLPKDYDILIRWLFSEIVGRGGKIVTSSQIHGGPFPGIFPRFNRQPFINVNGTDNGRDDNFFHFADAVYDRQRDVFIQRNKQLQAYLNLLNLRHSLVYGGGSHEPLQPLSVVPRPARRHQPP